MKKKYTWEEVQRLLNEQSNRYFEERKEEDFKRSVDERFRELYDDLFKRTDALEKRIVELEKEVFKKNGKKHLCECGE